MTRRIPILAVAIILLATPAFPAEPEEAQYNVVVSLFNAGQFDAALKKIQEREAATIPDPMRARYLHARALIHERAGKPDAARTAYAALLEKHPQAPECNGARIALLYLDHTANRNAEIVAAYPAIQQNALKPEERRNLALMFAEALVATGNQPQAITAYRQALQLGADAALVNPRLFDLYVRAGNHAELLAVSANGVTGMDPLLLALVRAEALLTTKRFAEAETEAAKIPAGHAHEPRASYVRAQALIGLNRPADAATPLALAIARWKDLPTPPVAWLTLATCQAETGNLREAAASAAQARNRLREIPEAQAADFRTRLAMLEINLATRTNGVGDVAAILERVQADLPADRLPDLLYQRVYALASAGNHKVLLDTMARDFPILQKGPHDGPATILYARALRATGQAEAAQQCLQDLITRKPDAPESMHARIEIAQAHLDAGRLDEAAALLDMTARTDLKKLLGPAIHHDVLFNRAILAIKRNQPANAIPLLTALLADKPAAPLLETATRALAQAQLDTKQYAQAAATWKNLLNQYPDDASLHERIATSLYLAGNLAAALEHLDRLAGMKDGAKPENLELAARILLDLKRPVDAAARYEQLYKTGGKKPAHAFECAVAWDRAGNTTNAAVWFETAARSRRDLPETYAGQVDALLAQARLASGTGDLGAGWWITRLTPDTDAATFNASLAALLRAIDTGRPNPDLPSRLEKACQAIPVGHVNRMALAAAHIAALARLGKDKDILTVSDAILKELAEAESTYPPGVFGSTIAPAMIRFHRGEALRRTGHPTDALLEYETVLSVYPYNEWPDAASCGVAECFAALGESDVAQTRFEEITKTGAKTPAAATWQAYAERRLRELKEGD
ncbi:MAG: hypothetical protein A2340_05425 [Lentisphaerae bacterium RIFOXYB12_FULL_60_10]|nr:MAG: hypothetical protein A2340_05425 [Lentisphaerae bacterium RIFOXYB12_FULL_60_10]